MSYEALFESRPIEVTFPAHFEEVQRSVHQNAVDKGFYENPDQNQGEKLALIHSELSEVLEALRKGNPPDDKIPQFSAVEAELADAVIRIMDMAQHFHYNVADAVIAKAAYNKTRQYKHGKKF